jgi:glycosyltransferase involved in cell wall biosynthesis
MKRLFGVAVAGGLSSETRVFARLLAERGDRYEALVVVHEEDGTEKRLADSFSALAQNPVVPLDTGWRPSPWSHRNHPGRLPVALRYRRRLGGTVATANSFRPDIVYSSQQHYDCRAASAVACALRVPQIVHLHYTIGPWLRRSVLTQLLQAHHIVAVSDFSRRQAISHGVPEHRVTTIHNTVPRYVRPDVETSRALRTELGLGDAPFVFGLVARMDPGKGHLDAIDAFERVARRRDDVWLVMVGTGRLERKIHARVTMSDVGDRILMTGQRSDVDALLSVFDALVHPATQDPCPLAVLEGMAAALPLIAYDDGGVPELIESGVSGVLVPDGAVIELADAMFALCEDPAAGRKLGSAAALRVASRFSPADAGARFAEIVASPG